jgi:hypothetical protein
VRAVRPALWLLAVACLAAVALGGCGGGGDSTASTQSQATTAPTADAGTTAKSQKEGGSSKGSNDQQSGQGQGKSTFTPKPHHDSGGGSAQFKVKGGDNSVQEFGEEGSESELQKAAAALHGFLDSRAEGDFKAACSYLGAEVAKSLQQLATASKQLKGAACPQLLAALSKGAPASVLAESAQADVGSLRHEGEQAFLIYRGARHAVYAISMIEEGGEWKVAGLSGTPLG